ncbi:MAG: UDP-2,3-diacylglucosamine diphosphatase [Gammaproteobacteria bacterium]
MATLFVSDLHLDAARPAATALFLRFLAERATAARALYILGDLFEAWIGDDDDSEPGASVATALQRLGHRGVPVYFIHGNRDFLLGPRYAAASGIRLLAETQVIDLYGEPTLIMHGDTLCTDDADYQALRTKVRSPRWQRRMLRLPLCARRWLARKYRADSRKATQRKTAAIMDVSQDAVAQSLRVHGVHRLIHGHTHRPAVHDFIVDGQRAQRIVLGDWYQQGSVLICDGGGCRLEAWH